MEDQEHLGRPGADALDLDQLRYHILIREPGQAPQIQFAVLDALSQVAKEADLRPREAGLAKGFRVGRDQLRGRRKGAVEGSDETLPDRAGRLGRELLADDRPG